ncbi:hypothetical protein [Streptomyces resistomycificus]|uniref:Uncharacterized protein n=1 Tax=Streptomyces resistomycificus TaxID=67356 RepID=A0A0L8LWB2_9ACTN|nr:hypothetical protein [Streptomyces resistomycificus]KOG42472.1 hypothetical protein ADK37_04950 [Streptomyces resistomycificus]KUN92623.1 hypothetical protein AQJ84_32055 [Streptomyces resistomycificus]
MQLPAYWMPRPASAPDRATTAAFDRLLDEALGRGPGRPVDYQLDAPKWQFLCHAAERSGIVLHGSGDPDIGRFEPRQPADTLEFSNRRAVFAATDGIWPMYYAILDRDRHPTMTLCNACIRIASPNSLDFSDPYYFFSISRPALDRQPWRVGTVYLLPADTFESQPPVTADDARIRIAQAASAVPVEPAAKLSVHPGDFPFLRQIRGHDDDRLRAQVAADPGGFPWVEGG